MATHPAEGPAGCLPVLVDDGPRRSETIDGSPSWLDATVGVDHNQYVRWIHRDVRDPKSSAYPLPRRSGSLRSMTRAPRFRAISAVLSRQLSATTSSVSPSRARLGCLRVSQRSPPARREPARGPPNDASPPLHPVLRAGKSAERHSRKNTTLGTEEDHRNAEQKRSHDRVHGPTSAKRSGVPEGLRRGRSIAVFTR